MTDIIIGARKTRPRRSRRFVVIGLLAVLAYVALRIALGWLVSYPNPDVEVSREALQFSTINEKPRLALADSSLETAPVAIVRASGNPVELGGALGRLMPEPLAASSQALSAAARHSQRGRDLAARFFGRDRGDWRLRHVDDGIPGHQLVEVAALAEGARIGGTSCNFDALVRGQASYDLAPPDPHSGGADLKATTRGLTIVSPLRGAAGERLILGRSFSTPGIAGGRIADSVVRLYRPEGVIAFAAIGDPAMVGVVTGINAEGLALMVHPVRTGDRATSDSAQSTPLLARDILENARTIEAAVDIIEAATPLGSAIYVLADAANPMPVVVERTPRRFGIREASSTYVVVDLLVSAELADEPESERNRRIRPAAAREARARALLAKTPPRSPTDIAVLLRDRSEAGGETLPPGHRAAIDDPTAEHVVIIDPAALVVWVNEGPGASGRYIALDLRHELRGEGKRPAPPPDIEADGAARVSAQAVVAARMNLITARRELGDGNIGRAREATARALLRAPTLPEAHMLAATIETRAGNADAARAHHRRVLGLGVDIPGQLAAIEDAAGADPDRR